MAIYQVTVRAQYFTQQIINVFSYVSAGGLGAAPSAFDLIKAMGFVPTDDTPTFPSDTIFSFWRALVNPAVLFTEVEARNLYSTTDFYLLGYSPTVAGLLSGAATSPFIAYGLRSDRVRTDIKRGFKRFVGVNEELMGSGGVLVPDAPERLDNLADAMSQVLEGDFDAVYNSAVLNFERYTTSSDHTAYRPYALEADQLEHAAFPVTWAGYDFVRSQTSRQYGRGA